MRTDRIMKIVGLNASIALTDTILFSPGFLGIQIGVSAFESALGVTTGLMSIMAFVYGNYKLLIQRDRIIQTNEIRTPEDCIEALKQSYDKKTFKNDIDIILEQIERINKKKETIDDILLQKFTSTEMSYAKFKGTITDIENVFYINVKSILNKLNAFDEEDYKRMVREDARNKFSAEFIETKMHIYNEYISFIRAAAEDNEQILLKLDKLLLEISKFNSLEDGEIENMSAMKEIDELINKTKLYK